MNNKAIADTPENKPNKKISFNTFIGILKLTVKNKSSIP